MLELENQHLALTKLVTDSDADKQQIILECWETRYSEISNCPPHHIFIIKGKVLVLVFYSYHIKLLQTYWLKTTQSYHSTFYIRSEVWHYLAGFFEGLMGIKSKNLHSFLDGLGKNSLSSSFKLMSHLVQCSCRTEVPISLTCGLLPPHAAVHQILLLLLTSLTSPLLLLRAHVITFDSLR